MKTYFCEDHDFETVTKYKNFTYEGADHRRQYVLTGMMIGASMKSSAVNYKTVSKGIARDRSLQKKIEDVSSKMMPPSVYVKMAAIHTTLLHELQPKGDGDRETSHKLHKNQVGMLKSDLAVTNIALQQVAEQTCTSSIPINPSIRKITGIRLEIGNAESVYIGKRCFVHTDMVKKQFARPCEKDPLIHHGTPNSEVKRRTGFPSQKALLLYIFIVCNGDVDTIKHCLLSLTWYEECFMHFEYQWGRTPRRMEDVMAIFNVHYREANTIIKEKYEQEFIARQSWPLYTSYMEDLALRNNNKWGEKYSEECSVMWNMTNLLAYAFLDTDLQRLTYSKYYGMNCFKGGVFVQPCGWMGTADLWPGTVTDLDYNRREGYLE